MAVAQPGAAAKADGLALPVVLVLLALGGGTDVGMSVLPEEIALAHLLAANTRTPGAGSGLPGGTTTRCASRDLGLLAHGSEDVRQQRAGYRERVALSGEERKGLLAPLRERLPSLPVLYDGSAAPGLPHS